MGPVQIVRATRESAAIIGRLGKQSFIEAHRQSGPAEDLEEYISKKYATDVIEAEIANPAYLIHLIHYQSQPAGFSKIEFNAPFPLVREPNACKLDRLYLIKEFYGLKLGYALFDFNLQLAKQADQSGFWLYVWKGNQRAFEFYKKVGFTVLGDADFRVSERLTNPNYILWKGLR